MAVFTGFLTQVTHSGGKIQSATVAISGNTFNVILDEVGMDAIRLHRVGERLMVSVEPGNRVRISPENVPPQFPHPTG